MSFYITLKLLENIATQNDLIWKYHLVSGRGLGVKEVSPLFGSVPIGEDKRRATWKSGEWET